jgi:PIN domain nuclease of toxin-antitoxin system
MPFLLDTHALLWWFTDDARLSPEARRVVEEDSNEVCVSAASALKISTKERLGKLGGISQVSIRFTELVSVTFAPLALLEDAITGEEFVTLNEIVGGVDRDSSPTPSRTEADPQGLETLYRSGIVLSGCRLAKTAVIDLRGWAQPGWITTGLDAFIAMDQWLTDLKTDTSDAPIEQKAGSTAA